MKLYESKERLDVQKSDLSGSLFCDVNISGSAFENVNCSGASFDDANMPGWRVHNANLAGLRIMKANLEHVPEKCKRFSDKSMLQLIDFERVLLPNATPRLANAL